MVFDERIGPGVERDTVRVLKISCNACGVERFGVDLIVLDCIAIDKRDLKSTFVSDYVTVGGVPSICLPTVPVREGEVDRGIQYLHKMKFYLVFTCRRNPPAGRKINPRVQKRNLIFEFHRCKNAFGHGDY